jgi:hypothetical protein
MQPYEDKRNLNIGRKLSRGPGRNNIVLLLEKGPQAAVHAMLWASSED